MGKNTYINDILKINKQKEKMIQGYKKLNKFTKILDESIQNVYYDNINFDNIYNILINISQIINDIELKYYDSKKFIYKSCKNIFEFLSRTNEFINILTILAAYMDKYTIYRMMRKFNNKKQKNILFFGGNAHTTNIFKVFRKTGYFDIILEKKSDNNCMFLT